MATKAVACRDPATRFHVTLCQSPGLRPGAPQEPSQTGVRQEDESGFEVNILNSLPWNRADARPEARLSGCSPAPDAEDADDAAAQAEEASGTLTGAQADAGLGLNARVAKSLSQLRLSASGSSANLRSLDCHCCSVSAASSGCRQAEESAEAQEAEELECDAEAPVCSGREPQHLGLPWSQNSSGWSRRTCSQRSQCSRDATCVSAASWHQLAAEHRCVRFGPRRKTFAHSLSHHDCQAEKAYQEYMSQLQDRVQMWLSQTEAPDQDPGPWEEADAEMATGAGSDRTSQGATFFLGAR